MVYLITYDMHAAYDYESIAEIIKTVSLGRFHHFQGSVWLIKSTQTAHEIFDKIKKVLHKSDELLVIPVGEKWFTNSWNTATGDVIRSWF